MKGPWGPFEDLREPFLLAETADWIVLFKPAGTHSVPGKSRGDLLSWYAAALPAAAAAFEGAEGRAAELGMASRLDEATSGLILFARRPEAAALLEELAASGRLVKEYRAVVSPSEASLPGSMPPRRPLDLAGGEGWRLVESRFRSYGPRGARVACVEAASGKPATREAYQTLIRSEGRAPERGAKAISVSARIRSGFRHQIRAHLAWSGWPILGDPLYGGAPDTRLFLEAHRIELGGERPVVFELYGGRP